MASITATLLLASLLCALILSSTSARDIDAELNESKKSNNGVGNPGYGSDPGSYFGPGGGFGVPGWGNAGGGYGSGAGGSGGGYSRNGVVPPSVVCSEKGPCYKKKLTCPAKCFTSYSRSGRNGGGGGGGGGCTMDCKKKCVAYC
ncbi:cold shock protein-1 precursor [Iris pallida]|uniref:Cold shock protein-1 n=1 Tax=Iris pallida TaxID=29817 RepID=A0AAX6DIF6_IRIPA|nr:cold shock protein-1 precursor [Iris pallida]KAJ6848862.1 cold shock protein-1 precursor [Iris pallida]